MWSAYSYVFMLCGYLVHNIWYQSKTILGFGSFKLVILEFSLLFFFGKVSRSKTWMDQEGNSEKDFIQVLALGSLSFRRYTLLKLGFVTSPKILSQTGVLGKMSIFEARELQIECYLLHWIEDGVELI